MNATKTTKTTGLKVKAGVKAGGLNFNHSRPAIRVSTAIKCGACIYLRNHSRALMR